MTRLQTMLALAVLAIGPGTQAYAATVGNVASGSVAVVSTGGQVFNNLLLNPDANRSNYMVFDLAQIAAGLGGLPIGSATLTITNPGLYQTQNASETYSLYDFGGDVDALRNYSFSAPPSAGVAASVRDDLRSGVEYGSVVISRPEAGSALAAVSITLTAAAIADLNAALGSAAKYFAIGGYADIAGPSVTSYLFNLSNGSGALGAGNALLDVQPVPLPAAVWLFGSALMGLGVMRRRRQGLAA